MCWVCVWKRQKQKIISTVYLLHQHKPIYQSYTLYVLYDIFFSVSLPVSTNCYNAMQLYNKLFQILSISSVQFSHSVLSDSWWPHESQHARPPCPSPTLRVHSDSHPLSQWCHPAISSWVVPFSSCPIPSQNQSLFQWVNPSHEVAKVLEFQL